MEKSTVFIAGGTGYIGKRLIGILLREGYDVIALVREQMFRLTQIFRRCQRGSEIFGRS